MTCNECSSQLSALLDGELTRPEEEVLRTHLAGCADCRLALEDLRELETLLRGRLTSGNFEAQLAAFDQRLAVSTANVVTLPAPTRRAPQAGSRGLGAVLLSSLALVALLVLLRGPGSPSRRDATLEVAKVAVALGGVEMMRPGDNRWVSLPQASASVDLEEGCRLRTNEEGLCEVQTSCEGRLRLNRETEVVVHRLEKVELVRGQLWGQAARQCALNVQLPPETVPEAPPRERVSLATFTCPSSSEMQWKVEDTQATCLALTSPRLSVTCENSTYSIGKGEAMTMANGRPDEVAFRTDPLAATSWQMPLLARKPPDDAELQTRLDSMLAVIGETKISYLYEEQIRELGPAGAAPLLAYVRSQRSRENPERRHRAMKLISETASADQVEGIEALLSDDDSTVRQSAAAALRRLKADRMPMQLKARTL